MPLVTWRGDDLARRVVVAVLAHLGIPATVDEVNLRDDYYLELWRGRPVYLLMQRRDGRWLCLHPCAVRRPWQDLDLEETIRCLEKST